MKSRVARQIGERCCGGSANDSILRSRSLAQPNNGALDSFTDARDHMARSNEVHILMRILDTLPVRHILPQHVAYYAHADANEQVRAYLRVRPHLQADEGSYLVSSFG
jgi:hypothetical protein